MRSQTSALSQMSQMKSFCLDLSLRKERMCWERRLRKVFMKSKLVVPVPDPEFLLLRVMMSRMMRMMYEI